MKRSIVLLLLSTLLVAMLLTLCFVVSYKIALLGFGIAVGLLILIASVSHLILKGGKP